MTKKLENFIDNIIEEKKAEFKGLIGKENRVENMIEDLKTLNLSNDKLEEVIKVAKKTYVVLSKLYLKFIRYSFFYCLNYRKK